jgi:peptidoglycan/LPS O-acetylase OafA/YrhL
MSSPPMKSARDPNLDLLRAMAILAVVISHIGNFWPHDHPALKSVAELGKYGVTLFFVLSGWLIGGIYWRERTAEGRVALGSFWIRRWLRTIPPYFAGLLLGYAAVAVGRSQPFDLHYLWFGQNYAGRMAFYQTSWSLCVEEHFYLALPIVAPILLRLPFAWQAPLLWALPVLPALLRLLDPAVDASQPFGYSQTATHLVCEGLAIGVAAAFTFHYHKSQWIRLKHWAGRLSIPAMLVFLSLIWWPNHAEYYIGQSVAAACCGVWLAAIAGRTPLPLASSKAVFAIAAASYSIYLTATLSTHAASRIAPPAATATSELLCLPLWLGAIGMAGTGFYYLVERNTLRFREYLLSAKVTAYTPPLLATPEAKTASLKPEAQAKFEPGRHSAAGFDSAILR